jgi:hypothetical protein
MDPAVLALLIPIVAIVCGTVLKALSMRSETRRGGHSSQLTGRLDALENEVGQLRQELGETQERLDFTERLLAQDRGINRIGPEH